jgi:hypothetical protein
MFNISKKGDSIMDGKRYKKLAVSLIVVIAVVISVIGSAVLSSPIVANARGATIYVSLGKVVAIQTHVARRGIMEVKSNRTGEVYKFYLGNRTAYYPHRYPYIGETVKVHYYNDRGYLKATSVEIQ